MKRIFRKSAVRLLLACVIITVLGLPEFSFAAKSINLNFLNGTNGFRVEGEVYGSRLGEYNTYGSGDVNGDGKNDYVLSSKYSPSVVRKAYLKFGNNSPSPSPLGTTEFALNNAVTLSAPNLGFATAFGDVNGDSIDDLLISGDSENTSGTYILFGRSHWTSTSINLVTMPASDGIMLNGLQPLTIQTKDINNDGCSDIVLTEGYIGGNGPRVAVVFGRTDWGSSSRIDVNAAIGQSAFQIRSQTGSYLLYCEDLTNANGDQYPDLLISYVYGQPRVSIVFGRADWLSNGGMHYVENALGGNGLTIRASNSANRLSVRPFPDINSDGIPEMIVSHDISTIDVYHLRMIYGNAGRISNSAILVDDLYADQFAVFTIQDSEYPSAGIPRCPGDITGDGKPDLTIARPWETSNGSRSGSVYVLPNPQDWARGTAINLAVLPESLGFKYVPVTYGEQLTAVHSVGDVNGDNIDDLLIGAPYMKPTDELSPTGGYYLIYGKAANAGIIPDIWRRY